MSATYTKSWATTKQNLANSQMQWEVEDRMIKNVSHFVHHSLPHRKAVVF